MVGDADVEFFYSCPYRARWGVMYVYPRRCSEYKAFTDNTPCKDSSNVPILNIIKSLFKSRLVCWCIIDCPSKFLSQILQ